MGSWISICAHYIYTYINILVACTPHAQHISFLQLHMNEMIAVCVCVWGVILSKKTLLLLRVHHIANFFSSWIHWSLSWSMVLNWSFTVLVFKFIEKLYYAMVFVTDSCNKIEGEFLKDQNLTFVGVLVRRKDHGWPSWPVLLHILLNPSCASHPLPFRPLPSDSLSGEQFKDSRRDREKVGGGGYLCRVAPPLLLWPLSDHQSTFAYLNTLLQPVNTRVVCEWTDSFRPADH